MSLEKGRIPDNQLMTLLMGFIVGTSIVLSPGKGAGHDAWIAVMIGIVEGLAVVWVFVTLSSRFRDKTIIQINDLVYGPILGKLISLLFIWYLFHTAVLVITINQWGFAPEIYPSTPREVILIVYLAACAATVFRGLEVIGRLSLILIGVSLILLGLDTLLLIPNMNLGNLLPVMDAPVSKILWAAHGAAMVPFAETIAFVMIFPFTASPKKNYGVVAASILVAGMLSAIIIARNSAVLGKMAEVYIYPSYAAVRVVNYAGVFNRIEILSTFLLTCLIFIKICILLYATVLGTAQLLALRSYRPLVWPTTILLVILALTNVQNMESLLRFEQIIHPIYAVPFEVVFPLVTLSAAIIRSLPKKEAVNQ